MGNPHEESAPSDPMKIAGPWRLLQSQAIIGDHGKRPVVLCGGRHGQLVTRGADGLLVDATGDNPNVRVVLAAPEMLAALKALVAANDPEATCTCGIGEGGYQHSDECPTGKALPAALAAIARAEGR